MKHVIVYHDNEMLASRGRRPKTGETISYRSIEQWDENANKKFDEVVNLSSKRKSNKKKETTAVVDLTNRKESENVDS